MAKYHNSPNGPRPCHSEKGKCPYALAGKPHFESQVEAQKAYDKTMAEAFGNVPTLNRGAMAKARQVSYRGQDNLRSKVKMAAASPAAVKAAKSMQAMRESAAEFSGKLEALRGEMREEILAGQREQNLGKTWATLEARGSLQSSKPVQRQYLKALNSFVDSLGSSHDRAETRRFDEVKIGDRLDTQEIVVGVERIGQCTQLILQSPKGGAGYKAKLMPSGEPVRTARQRRRKPTRMRAALGNSMRIAKKIAPRVMQAGRMQADVLRTLRGVEVVQRAQAAYKLPQVKPNNAATSLRDAKWQEEKRNLPMKRVTLNQFKHYHQGQHAKKSALDWSNSVKKGAGNSRDRVSVSA